MNGVCVSGQGYGCTGASYSWWDCSEVFVSKTLCRNAISSCACSFSFVKGLQRSSKFKLDSVDCAEDSLLRFGKLIPCVSKRLLVGFPLLDFTCVWCTTFLAGSPDLVGPSNAKDNISERLCLAGILPKVLLAILLNYKTMLS